MKDATPWPSWTTFQSVLSGIEILGHSSRKWKVHHLSIGPFWNWNLNVLYLVRGRRAGFQSVLSGIEIWLALFFAKSLLFFQSVLSGIEIFWCGSDLWFPCCLSIGPFWNWNTNIWSKSHQSWNFQSVLSGIEIGQVLKFNSEGNPFNRSFLELKFTVAQSAAADQSAFNRSFLELKCQKLSQKKLKKSCFQSVLSGIEIRIGMDRRNPTPFLSIGPFWNWNVFVRIGRPAQTGFQSVLSGIEMELSEVRNRYERELSIGPFWNWNKVPTALPCIGTVLSIGPFWNWNVPDRNLKRSRIILSIGPFWNWNRLFQVGVFR